MRQQAAREAEALREQATKNTEALFTNLDNRLQQAEEKHKQAKERNKADRKELVDKLS